MTCGGWLGGYWVTGWVLGYWQEVLLVSRTVVGTVCHVCQYVTGLKGLSLYILTSTRNCYE